MNLFFLYLLGVLISYLGFGAYNDRVTNTPENKLSLWYSFFSWVAILGLTILNIQHSVSIKNLIQFVKQDYERIRNYF